MSTLDQILQYKIVAILRGADPAHLSKIADALYEGGIRVLEITMNSKDAIKQISGLSRSHGKKMLIGAGTVLNVNDASAALDAGALFLISPGLDVEVVDFTKRNGLVSIPGAYTATEVMHADRAGADIVKVFPVSSADYIKNLHAPLDKIRLMPTGGINTDNIDKFSKAGAVAFGIGSALVDKNFSDDDNYYNLLTEKARAFVKSVASFNSSSV